MISAEFDAVKARLAADTSLKVRDSVYEDGTTTGAVFYGTYVVLFGGGPDRLDDERLAKTQALDSDATYVYTVRCVAATAQGARYVLQHVCTQLIGFVPSIAGRSCDPMWLSAADEVQPDTSLLKPLFFCDPEFTLVSRTP